VLQVVSGLNLPPIEALTVAEARTLRDVTAVQGPPTPEIGEIVDGVLPGPAGKLEYRLYRPDTPGPHPLVAYFHGGGWVLGGKDSDEPLCRDLCVRSGVGIVSVNYRHAPEAPFPAAVEDAWAATRWIVEQPAELGGIAGQFAVAGRGAGANLATVVCQLARNASGPAIRGQLLLTPVTDCQTDRGSYKENADGFILTANHMRWFLDNYIDAADREDPRASPLRGNLTRLPPAAIVTADFDPLRDDGLAYAEALESAGVSVRRIRARGHIHTSVTMVDVVISGATVRAEMAAVLNGWFPANITSRAVGVSL
jgi:acetyl esterase/lipase